MNVIVCVKQIPDPAVPGALDGSTNTLKRDGKLILDDSDAYGVEMALQLVDKAGTARRPVCAPHSPWAPPRACS
jgi:electron transfer flavoprotein beta subunit